LGYAEFVITQYRKKLWRVLQSPRRLRANLRDVTFRGLPGPIYLAVCMIFRDEAPYLREWLDFHLHVGVEHFYLYNNRSTDHYADELAPYMGRGVVTLTDWPEVPGQRTAYLHCIDKNAMTARWISFIDADEFLYSLVGTDIRTVLKGHEHIPAVGVARYEFGSSGHKTRPAGPVLSSYVFRHRHPRGASKAINNPRLVRGIKNAHRCQFFVADARFGCEALRINHYWSRSLEDLAAKQKKTDKGIAWLRSFSLEEMLEHETTNNEVEDRLIIDIAKAASLTLIN
jgi:hypothetical protein